MKNTNITPKKYKQKYKKNTVPKVREIQTKTQILRGDTETQIGNCLFSEPTIVFIQKCS